MNTSNQTARRVFEKAVEISEPDEQIKLVESECAGDEQLRDQVLQLLEANSDAGSFMEAGADADETRSVENVEKLRGNQEYGDVKVGVVLGGRYELLENIGEGGMGSVWVAKQKEPVKRKVAIKLVKAGMDSKQVLARFESERQALAVMDHPNIAKIFDGGMTPQGRPYFVMEYVKGIPFTEYCDSARLSLRERLELFIPVCQAIQHAHHKGIVHRDLKPSNILICLYDGYPVPKVIDFGLAKALHHSLTDRSIYTAHGMMVGTPIYMSPEQAEFNNLDIDTRTDIYSLGVVLYELLTGTTPLERQQLNEAALHEVLRIIREVEPARPSLRLSGSDSLPSIAAQRRVEPRDLQKSLSGDLDWIVMKALDKERSRRYETANSLSRDIERFLTDEAIEARPPSTRYRLKKFIQKNRFQVATLSLTLLTLFAGVVGTGWGLWNSRIAESKAITANDELKDALKREELQRKAAVENQAKSEEQTIKGILRPIGHGDRPNKVELQSLVDWASFDTIRMKLKTLRSAFNDKKIAIRVARRADRVIQACAGIDASAQNQTIELLKNIQQKSESSSLHFAAATWLLLELGEIDENSSMSAFDCLREIESEPGENQLCVEFAMSLLVNAKPSSERDSVAVLNALTGDPKASFSQFYEARHTAMLIKPFCRGVPQDSVAGLLRRFDEQVSIGSNLRISISALSELAIRGENAARNRALKTLLALLDDKDGRINANTIVDELKYLSPHLSRELNQFAVNQIASKLPTRDAEYVIANSLAAINAFVAKEDNLLMAHQGKLLVAVHNCLQYPRSKNKFTNNRRIKICLETILSILTPTTQAELTKSDFTSLLIRQFVKSFNELQDPKLFELFQTLLYKLEGKTGPAEELKRQLAQFLSQESVLSKGEAAVIRIAYELIPSNEMDKLLNQAVATLNDLKGVEFINHLVFASQVLACKNLSLDRTLELSEIEELLDTAIASKRIQGASDLILAAPCLLTDGQLEKAAKIAELGLQQDRSTQNVSFQLISAAAPFWSEKTSERVWEAVANFDNSIDYKLSGYAGRENASLFMDLAPRLSSQNAHKSWRQLISRLREETPKDRYLPGAIGNAIFALAKTHPNEELLKISVDVCLNSLTEMNSSGGANHFFVIASLLSQQEQKAVIRSAYSELLDKVGTSESFFWHYTEWESEYWTLGLRMVDKQYVIEALTRSDCVGGCRDCFLIRLEELAFHEGAMIFQLPVYGDLETVPSMFKESQAERMSIKLVSRSKVNDKRRFRNLRDVALWLSTQQ